MTGDIRSQVTALVTALGSESDRAEAVLGLSKRTVEGDWAHARAWLQRELDHGGRG